MQTKLLLGTLLIFSTTLFCADLILARFYICDVSSIRALEEQPLEIDIANFPLTEKTLRTLINQIKNVGNRKNKIYFRLYFSDLQHVDSSAFTKKDLTLHSIKAFVNEQGVAIEK